MNILVNELKKSVALLLNQFENLLSKLNIINNNFLLMRIPGQLVFLFIQLIINIQISFNLEIENDFKLKLQEHVAKLDSEKAVLLAQLEKELNIRQERILETARKRIDDLNEEANRLKMVYH
jgi:hypothetical protein